MAEEILCQSTKVCKLCARELPATAEFFREQARGGNLRHACKKCVAAAARKDREPKTLIQPHGPDYKECNGCKKVLPLADFYAKEGRAQSHCKECVKASNAVRYNARYKNNPEYHQKAREYHKRRHAEHGDAMRQKNRRNHRIVREMCIQHYGGKCECCGEDKYEFLALDHIDGGGRKHHASVGNKLCRWLVRNNFPQEPRIRVLCHNCNMARGFYGYCPHQKQ